MYYILYQVKKMEQNKFIFIFILILLNEDNSIRAKKNIRHLKLM